MLATNVSSGPVELAHINGAGMLPAAGDDGDTRTLVEVTDRERHLEAAGKIVLSEPDEKPGKGKEKTS